MYNDDSWGGTLIGTLLFGGMYLLGNMSGRAELTKEIKEANRDQEIERLRRELDQLKKANIIN